MLLLADSCMPFIGLNRLALPQRVACGHKVSVHLKLSQTDLAAPVLLLRSIIPQISKQRDWLGWNLSPQKPIRKKGILKPSKPSAHKQKYPQTMMRKMILLSLIYRFPLGTLLLILILEANKFSSTLPPILASFTSTHPNAPIYPMLPQQIE